MTYKEHAIAFAEFIRKEGWMPTPKDDILPMQSEWCKVDAKNFQTNTKALYSHWKEEGWKSYKKMTTEEYEEESK